MSKLAVVFPGQGAQKAGMGKDFCDSFAESRSVFERASGATGIDMQQLCFTENEQLNQTEFTQPAILTAEIALYSAIVAQQNLTPSLFAGHSLGEYTALVAAGVIPLEAAVQIVRRRGALMQSAVPLGTGAMAALIGDTLGTDDYLSLVKGAGAEVANFNSAKQVVISGRKESVEAACAKIKESFPSITIIPLNVSAPFHCSMMRGIEKDFESYLRSFAGSFDHSRAKLVVSNFSGELHTVESMISSLVSQISGSVRWQRNMEVIAAGSTEVLEVGPTRVLSKFLSTIDVTAKAVTDLRSYQKTYPVAAAAVAASA